MRVISVPFFKEVEEVLSSNSFFSQEEYDQVKTKISEEGYVPISIIAKRKVLPPPFALKIPIKILEDWEPEVKDADMKIILGRKHA